MAPATRMARATPTPAPDSTGNTALMETSGVSAADSAATVVVVDGGGSSVVVAACVDVVVVASVVGA
jgi:hypothetical protein